MEHPQALCLLPPGQRRGRAYKTRAYMFRYFTLLQYKGKRPKNYLKNATSIGSKIFDSTLTVLNEVGI